LSSAGNRIRLRSGPGADRGVGARTWSTESLYSGSSVESTLSEQSVESGLLPVAQLKHLRRCPLFDVPAALPLSLITMIRLYRVLVYTFILLPPLPLSPLCCVCRTRSDSRLLPPSKVKAFLAGETWIPMPSKVSSIYPAHPTLSCLPAHDDWRRFVCLLDCLSVTGCPQAAAVILLPPAWYTPSNRARFALAPLTPCVSWPTCPAAQQAIFLDNAGGRQHRSTLPPPSYRCRFHLWCPCRLVPCADAIGCLALAPMLMPLVLMLLLLRWC